MVREKIVGFAIVAVDISLPQLVTSVVAALKKNSNLAIGNVIGPNIFNVLLISSVSSLIHPGRYNLKFNQIYILMGGQSGKDTLFSSPVHGRRSHKTRSPPLVQA